MFCQLTKFSNISYSNVFSYDNRIRPSPVVTASSQNGKNSICMSRLIKLCAVSFRIKPSQRAYQGEREYISEVY